MSRQNVARPMERALAAAREALPNLACAMDALGEEFPQTGCDELNALGRMQSELSGIVMRWERERNRWAKDI